MNAAPVAPEVKGRTWRAYLSTTKLAYACGDALLAEAGIDARDRIGGGPWYNFAGKLVAEDIDSLHVNGIAPALILTEGGNALAPGEVHVVTGSTSSGTVEPAAFESAQQFGFGAGNCCNWTTSNDFANTVVGHAQYERPDSAGVWNADHTFWCAFLSPEPDIDPGARIYCFATD